MTACGSRNPAAGPCWSSAGCWAGVRKVPGEPELLKCSDGASAVQFLLHQKLFPSPPVCQDLSAKPCPFAAYRGNGCSTLCPTIEGICNLRREGTSLPAKEITQHGCWVAEFCPVHPTQLPKGFAMPHGINLAQTSSSRCQFGTADSPSA